MAPRPDQDDVIARFFAELRPIVGEVGERRLLEIATERRARHDRGGDSSGWIGVWHRWLALRRRGALEGALHEHAGDHDDDEDRKEPLPFV